MRKKEIRKKGWYFQVVYHSQPPSSSTRSLTDIKDNPPDYAAARSVFPSPRSSCRRRHSRHHVRMCKVHAANVRIGLVLVHRKNRAAIMLFDLHPKGSARDGSHFSSHRCRIALPRRVSSTTRRRIAVSSSPPSVPCSG